MLTALERIGGQSASGALCLVIAAGVLLIVAIRYWGK